tara:strand:- start:596 stop:922 length:327 start_codon:yes stop_codon:yes gene_type:complete
MEPPKAIGHVVVDGEDCTLSIGQYVDNGRLAVMLHCQSGEPYAIVSTNISELPIEDDEFFVKWYDLNPKIMSDLIECKFFEDTGKAVSPAGGERDVVIPVWRMRGVIR